MTNIAYMTLEGLEQISNFVIPGEISSIILYYNLLNSY